MATESHTTLRSSLGVLRSGMFGRFMVAEFISMVGSWMQTQAQQFLVEENARTSMDQAFIMFALTIVIPFFNPLGGAVADRADRRKILMLVVTFQGLMALTVGGLVHFQTWTKWHLVAISVVMGISHAFEGPAYSGLIAQLVPKEKLSAAVAVDRSVFHSARIIGPALAGVAVAKLGTESAFFANAFSFLAPLLILFTLPRPTKGTPEEEKARRTGFWDGWRFVRGDAPTLRMVLVMSANALFCSPFVIVLLTFYARRTLGLDPVGIGWLMSLTGIGALTASFVILAVPPSRRVWFLRIGSTVSVVSMFVLAAAHTFLVAALAFSFLTMGLNFVFGIGNQLVQERAPDVLRGRVSAVAAMSFVGVIPFSGLLAAGLDGWLGMRQAMQVSAVAYAIISAGMLARRWPVLGRAAAPVAEPVPCEEQIALQHEIDTDMSG